MAYQYPVVEEWVLEGPEEATSPLLMLATVAEQFRKMEHAATSASSDSLPSTPGSPRVFSNLSSPTSPSYTPVTHAHSEPREHALSSVSVDDHFTQSLTRFAQRSATVQPTTSNALRRTHSSLSSSSAPSLSPKTARRHQPYTVAHRNGSSSQGQSPSTSPTVAPKMILPTPKTKVPRRDVGKSINSHFARSLKPAKTSTSTDAFTRVERQSTWSVPVTVAAHAQTRGFANTVPPSQTTTVPFDYGTTPAGPLHAYAYGNSAQPRPLTHPQGVFSA